MSFSVFSIILGGIDPKKTFIKSKHSYTVFFWDALQHITWKKKTKIVRVTARSISADGIYAVGHLTECVPSLSPGRGPTVIHPTFCTSREYGDYGHPKIKRMANTWSVISRIQIDEIKKIERGFKEYNFDFIILNWTTRITCFTCSTFLLSTPSFLCIFYEIKNLRKQYFLFLHTPYVMRK